jgi:hypothetical protein
VAVAIIVLLLLILLKILVFPGLGKDVYGDRLDDIDKYKVSDKVISTIKEDLKSQTAVDKVVYHREGRILNFSVTLDTAIKKDDARKYANILSENLSKKLKKYYDIQIIFETEDSSDDYPLIGYKNKSSDDFVWSDNSE